MIKISHNNNETQQKHDKGYKRIFANKNNFLNFLKKYIAKPWAENITAENIEQINNSYITKEYKDLSDDIIYKIKFNDEDVYFYVLLELQSKVDFTMPFRLLQYMTALLSDVLKNTNKNKRKRKKFKIPAIVPIVLYNGKDKWTAELEYKNYTQNSHIFGENIINFKYLLFDLNRTDEATFKQSVKTLLDYIFAFDYNRDETDIEDIVKLIPNIAKDLNKDDLEELCRWIRYNLFEGNLPPKVEDDFIEKFTKGDDDMTHAFERWVSRIRNEEWQDGKEAGRQEGEKAGIIKTALNLLKKNMPVDFIMETTGLSEKEIKSLAIV